MSFFSLSSRLSPSRSTYQKMEAHLARDSEDTVAREKAMHAAAQYLTQSDPCKTARRANKLLALDAAAQPKTPTIQAAGICMRGAITKAVPGYAMALLFWQRLDYASALAEAVSAGFRHQFSRTPIVQGNVMQTLIRGGGNDELAGLREAFDEIWLDHAIDERAAVRLAERAPASLLAFLVSDAAQARIDLEAAIEHLSAQLSFEAQDCPVFAEPSDKDAKCWADLQHVIAIGLPHPAEVTLQRICAPVLAEKSSFATALIRKRQILQGLRHLDLRGPLAFMSSSLGRKYALLSQELYPFVTQDLGEIIPVLRDRLTLTQWSLQIR